MASSFGTLLRQAREVRGLSGSDAARAAGISAAYLSKLESDAVKSPRRMSSTSSARPSRCHTRSSCDCRATRCRRGRRGAWAEVGAALFADLTDDERDELLEYLAWYRARRRSTRGAAVAS